MKRVALLVFLVVLLTACGGTQPALTPYSTYCPQAEVERFVGRALDPLREFLDLFTVAADTPRVNLPGVITQMQAARRRFQGLSYPPCLETYVSYEVESMDEAIAGHLAFMGQRSTEVCVSHFKKSNESYELAQKALKEVLSKTGE